MTTKNVINPAGGVRFKIKTIQTIQRHYYNNQITMEIPLSFLLLYLSYLVMTSKQSVE